MARRANPVRRLQQRYSGEGGRQAWEVRNQQLDDPFARRVVQPLIDRLQRIASRLGSKKDKSQLADLLAKAGYPGGLSVGQLASVRLLLVGGVFASASLLGSGVLFLLGWKNMILYAVLGGVMLGAISYVMFPFLLRRMVKKRQVEITKQLPDVLDLITIAVEAGMGFDAAMDRVGNRFQGAMGEELLRTGQEIRMGRPWNDAMKDLGERTGVEDLRSLTTALLQSRELGVNLSNVLHAQSLRLREERARRAREAAQKTPTKIIFPLVGCIFPTLFIVLMGPAMLRALKELKANGMFK